MPVTGHDTLQVRRSLPAGDLSYDYFSIPDAAKTLGDLTRLPFSLKVLLENLLRLEDGRTVTVRVLEADVAALEGPDAAWNVINAAALAAHLAATAHRGHEEDPAQPDPPPAPLAAVNGATPSTAQKVWR